MAHKLAAGARKAFLFLAAFLTSAAVVASVRSIVTSENPAFAADRPATSEAQPASSEEQPATSENPASVPATLGGGLPAFDRNALFLPSTHVAVWTDAPSFTEKNAIKTPYVSYGRASYHGAKSRTASGENPNVDDLTAAHPTLPFGTRVRVTNLFTGKSVTVRINDRGPFVHERIVDVSYSAAKQLGMIASGVAHVKVEVVD
jgi:rare lipoprotein A